MDNLCFICDRLTAPNHDLCDNCGAAYVRDLGHHPTTRDVARWAAKKVKTLETTGDSICNVNLTSRELANLGDMQQMKFIFATLYRKWVDPCLDPTHDIRTGNIYTQCDENGILKFRFTAQVQLSHEEQELVEKALHDWRTSKEN